MTIKHCLLWLIIISGKITIYKNKFQMTNPDYIQTIDKEMSIEEELSQYLSQILDLAEEQIDSILRTFSDYSQKAAME